MNRFASEKVILNWLKLVLRNIITVTFSNGHTYPESWYTQTFKEVQTKTNINELKANFWRNYLTSSMVTLFISFYQMYSISELAFFSFVLLQLALIYILNLPVEIAQGKIQIGSHISCSFEKIRLFIASIFLKIAIALLLFIFGVSFFFLDFPG